MYLEPHVSAESYGEAMLIDLEAANILNVNNDIYRVDALLVEHITAPQISRAKTPVTVNT